MDDEEYTFLPGCTCEACMEREKDHEAALGMEAQVTTGGSAKATPGPLVMVIEEAVKAGQAEADKIYQRRFAAIDAAIRANLPRVDDPNFNPLQTPQIARAFLDLMENGLASQVGLTATNVRQIN